MKEKRWAYGLVMLSAVMWAFSGVFSTELGNMGFTALELGLVRTVIALLVTGLFFLVFDRSYFRLRTWKDLRLFLGMTLFGFCMYNVVYMAAVREMGISVAGALFYTYPAFVLLQSRVLFGQKITVKKAVVLAMTLCGCGAVCGIFGGGFSAISGLGLGYGFISAFCFGLYGVLGKKALSLYPSQTVTVYTFLIGSLAMLLFSHPADTLKKLAQPGALWLFVLFAMVVSVIPYLVYLKGLTQVEPATAAILSTLEPIVAALLGVVYYKEALTVEKICGIVLIIGAVCLMNSRVGEGWRLKKE